ncbi:MAG: hypothetical protein H6725_05210 [Sandaracinaceae bacterium]|nr:hypothetical protein [Sandaracinaceae bacterium]
MSGLLRAWVTPLGGLVLFFTLSASGACATSFTGSANVEGGAAGCRRKCSAEGLYFAGMVHLGEYSNGCICSVDASREGVSKAVAGAGPAAVGVMTQMRAAQSQ